MQDNTNRALQYAVKLLEREWEKSGEEKYSDEVAVVELRELYNRIVDDVRQEADIADSFGEVSFATYLDASHRNYISLRLGRKIVKVLERAEEKGKAFGRLKFDKEEHRYYENLKARM